MLAVFVDLSKIESSKNLVKFLKQPVVVKNAALTEVLERIETFLVIFLGRRMKQ